MATQTGNITIQYQNATFTTTAASIVIGNGTCVLGSNSYFSMSGTFTFSTLNVSSGLISIDNTSPGIAANGTVTIPLSAPGGAPTITANNFSGTAIVTWPTTNQGPQNEQLTPGQQITLNNFGSN
ncbi:MAG TPA: hypothetical protein VNU97_07585 [Rhizomicrobium sp.]|jgi:hypothetical protein|nr:hypothetical protein [Rhizomicrobium sp.]